MMMTIRRKYKNNKKCGIRGSGRIRGEKHKEKMNRKISMNIV